LNAEQVKGKVKSIAQKTKVDHQSILQSFFLERLLERISVSQYKENFILKGGLLIASIIGISSRSTMDIDTTIKAYPVNQEDITKLLTEVLSIDLQDDVSFEIQSIKTIREEDDYEGYRAIVKATFGKIEQHVKVDVSTGDVITPSEINYTYKSIFEDKNYNVMAYNLETILAEKIETVIRRGEATTRMRDYYDIHILKAMQQDNINKDLLIDALENTSRRRGSDDLLEMAFDVIEIIETSDTIKKLWGNYRKKYHYASEIEFNEIIDSIKWIAEYSIA